MYHHTIYPNPVSSLSWTIPMYPKWKWFLGFLCLPQIGNSPNVLIENDRFCHSSHKSLQRFPISLKKWKNKKKKTKQNYSPHQKISPFYICFPVTSLIPSSTHPVLFAWLQLYVSFVSPQSHYRYLSKPLSAGLYVRTDHM